MKHKALKIVFVLLLVGIIAEVGAYFLFAQPERAKNPVKPQTTDTVDASSATTYPTLKPYKESSEKPIFTDENLYALEILKGRPNTNAYLVIEQEGIIDKIDYNVPEGFYVQINIVDDDGNKIIDQLYRKSMLDELEIYRDEEDSKIPIKIDDVREGDKVSYTRITDILNDVDIKNELVVLE